MAAIDSQQHDVVIVGGGSTGSVLAARLSEDPTRSVPLLEAGHAHAGDAYPELVVDGARVVGDADTSWGYTARGGRESLDMDVRCGKVLGGSSAVNATLAIRTRAADLAKWAGHGVEGWSFEEATDTYRLLPGQTGLTNSLFAEVVGATAALPPTTSTSSPKSAKRSRRRSSIRPTWA